jgi:NAD(P)-dependent dehydrogenase (short-subunit alcohol dehydrogenase family)
MDIHSIAQEDNVIIMEWTMTMVFRRLPCTLRCTAARRLTLHEDGRIVEQRDYYDLWGDIFDRVPVLRVIYRSFHETVLWVTSSLLGSRGCHLEESHIPDRLQFLPNMMAAQKATDASLEGKTCVISGATSGVGLAAVRRIARGGADILVIARNSQKAEDLRSLLKSESGTSIDVVIADLVDLDEVRNAASVVLERCPKIHLLINSAGVFSTKRIVTPGGFELAFCVNHLAPFLLTRLLLRRIIESAPARIIQVNSQGHRFGGLRINDLNWERRLYNGYLGYGASKTAQLLTVWGLADVSKGNTGYDQCYAPWRGED